MTAVGSSSDSGVVRLGRRCLAAFPIPCMDLPGLQGLCSARRTRSGAVMYSALVAACKRPLALTKSADQPGCVVSAVLTPSSNSLGRERSFDARAMAAVKGHTCKPFRLTSRQSRQDSIARGAHLVSGYVNIVAQSVFARVRVRLRDPKAGSFRDRP